MLQWSPAGSGEDHHHGDHFSPAKPLPADNQLHSTSMGMGMGDVSSFFESPTLVV